MASKLDKAVASLILSQPFYAAMLLKQRMAVDESEETLATDGQTLTYNPQFVDSITHDELVGCLAHEVMHVAHLHHTRLAGRDPENWNIAADYAINGLLVDSGFRLPKGALIDRRYDGLSAEQIYGQIGQQPKPQGGQPGPGKVKAPADTSQAGITAAEQQAIVDTIQAAQAAKGAGNLPGSIAQYVQTLKQPNEDWRSLLWEFAEQVSKSDYTFARPNKRYMQAGIYLPSLHSRTMGTIAIAVDTSGSIDDSLVQQFLAECQAVLDTCGPESLVIIQCDTAVTSLAEYTPGDVIDMHIVGRGGTAFQPAFDKASEYSPACLVYLTDGDCYDTPGQPDYPVLWALYGRSARVPVPWGQIVHIDR